MKNIYKHLIGSLLAAVSLTTGCLPASDREGIEQEPTKPYFAEVPMRFDSGIAMTNGDFDGDGDLDIIVGAREGAISTNGGRLYHFENDGLGNFTLKTKKTSYVIAP